MRAGTGFFKIKNVNHALLCAIDGVVQNCRAFGNYRSRLNGGKMDNYIRKMPKPSAPGLYFCNVLHDDWCNFLSGNGECNCTPEYVTRKYAAPDIKEGPATSHNTPIVPKTKS